jgi:hypothetical protein
MKNVNYSLLGLACGFLLAVGAIAPLPAHAAKVFNVKSYGAVGNGTTDDTTAILAATAAANAVPGSTLLFPEGSYLVSSIFTVKGIEVVGQSATVTTSSLAGLEVGGNNTRVHDMRFTSQLSANSGTVGILVSHATNFEIRDNTFTGLTDCVSVGQSSNGKINANSMQLSSASISGVSLSNATNVMAQQNVIGGSGGSTAGAFRPSSSTKVTISSNKITNVAFGIFSQQDTDDTYTNNNFNQLNNNGIDLNTDTRITVTSNRITSAKGTAVRVFGVDTALIRNNILTGGQTGINLVSGSTTIVISGNEITSVTNAITGGLVNQLTITGNIIDNVTSGFNQNSDANLVISFNKITTCSNAGILVTNCIGTTEIQDNVLRFCALSPSNPKAIIYANCPIGRLISIDSNTGTGSTNATYFIWCVQPSPPAMVKGNRTNTGLPNRIGS